MVEYLRSKISIQMCKVEGSQIGEEQVESGILKLVWGYEGENIEQAESEMLTC